MSEKRPANRAWSGAPELFANMSFESTTLGIDVGGIARSGVFNLFESTVSKALAGVLPDSSSAYGSAAAADTLNDTLRAVMPERVGIDVGDMARSGVFNLFESTVSKALAGVLPDSSSAYGSAAAADTLNDTLRAALSDKVRLDYGALVGSLGGIETPAFAGPLIGLTAIDVVAFRAQHSLLEHVAQLSEARFGFAAQATQILSSQGSLQHFVRTTVPDPKRTDLYATLRQVGVLQAHLGARAVADDLSLMLQGATRSTGRLYDAYLHGLPPRPITRRADVARYAGSAQTGLLIAESLTSIVLDNPTDDDDLPEQLAAVVELQAWEIGPAQAREDLYAALAEVQADLPDWLKSAWEDVVRDGVKAVSKVAHCLIECIDRTLRVLAPVSEVEAWIAQVGVKPGWLGNDRPTRRAKVMYVMRHRSERDANLAAAQVESLNAQVEASVILIQEVAAAVQAVKHSEAPTMTIMRSWVLAAEGALSQLLLHR